MHFCPKCEIIYQTIRKRQNKLIYYCRNCNEDTSLISNLNNLYVSKSNIKNEL